MKSWESYGMIHVSPGIRGPWSGDIWFTILTFPTSGVSGDSGALVIDSSSECSAIESPVSSADRKTGSGFPLNTA